MKKILVSSTLLLAILSSAFSQKAPMPPVAREQTQNITIRKKGGDKEKTTIVIDGDKITVNGKPLKEYKGDIQISENGNAGFDITPPLPPLPPMNLHGGAKSFSRDLSFYQNDAFLGVYSEDNDGGAKVNSVTKSSPAEKAGLKEGDVITKAGDDKIADSDDLMDAIGKYKPEDKITITYLRDKKENNATVTLEKNRRTGFTYGFGDNEDLLNTLENISRDGNENKPRLGIRIQDVETGTGVKVTDIDDEESPAAKAGLKEEDVIMQINGKTISSVKDAKDMLAQTKPGDNVTVIYQRKGSNQTATLHLPKPLQSSDL